MCFIRVFFGRSISFLLLEKDSIGFMRIYFTLTCFLILAVSLLGQSGRRRGNFQPDQDLFLQADSNCYELMRQEAERAYRLRQFDAAAALFRAAKSCDDANQDRRKAMDSWIVECRDAAEKALRISEQRARDAETQRLASEREILLKDRSRLVSIASQRALDAQNLLRRFDRTLAYRLAYFANEFISPEGENNPNCLQAMYDAWYFTPSEYTGGAEYDSLKVPFCFEIGDRLEKANQVRFFYIRNEPFVGVFNSETNTLSQWNLTTFQQVPPRKIAKMLYFDVSGDGRTLMFYNQQNAKFERDGRATAEIPLEGARIFSMSQDGMELVYYNTETSDIRILALSDLMAEVPVVQQNIANNIQQQYQRTAQLNAPQEQKQKRYEKNIDYNPVVGRNLPVNVTQPLSVGVVNDEIWLAYSDSVILWRNGSKCKISIDWSSFVSYAQINKFFILPKGRAIVYAGPSQTFLLKIPDLTPDGAVLQPLGFSGTILGLQASANLICNYVEGADSGNGGLYFQRVANRNTVYAAPLPDDERFSTALSGDFSPDGAWMGTISDGGVLKLWALSEPPGEEICQYPEADYSTVLSEDGKQIFTLEKEQLFWYDLSGGKMAPHRINTETPPVSLRCGSKNWVAFLNAGDSLVVKRLNGTKTFAWKVAMDQYYPPAVIDSSGELLAFAIDSSNVVIFSLATEKVVARRTFNGLVLRLIFIPGQMEILTVTASTSLYSYEPAQTIKRWKFGVNGVPQLIPLLGYEVQHVAFNAAENLLAFSDGNDIRLYREENMQEEHLRIRPFGQRAVGSLAFSPDGQSLAVGYSDGRIAFWDVRTAKLRFTWKTAQFSSLPYINQLAFRENGRQLAILTLNNDLFIRELNLWQLHQNAQGQFKFLAGFRAEQIRDYELEEALAFSNNFERLAMSGDAPLIRSFLDYYIDEARNTNSIQRLSYLASRATALYDRLESGMQTTLRPSILELLEYFHWRLILSGRPADADRVAIQIQSLSKNTTLHKVTGAHTALLGGRFSEAIFLYTDWILTTFENNPEIDFNLQIQELNDKFLDLARYERLSPEQIQGLCGVFGGFPSFDRLCPTPYCDPVWPPSAGVIPLKWAVISQIYRSHQLGGYWEKVKSLEKAYQLARELPQTRSGLSPKYEQTAKFALHEALDNYAFFEQSNAKTLAARNQIIQMYEGAQDTLGLEILALQNLQLGDQYLESDSIAKARYHYSKGMAAVSALLSNSDLSHQRDYRNRLLGPLLSRDGIALLFQNQPRAALVAFDSSNAMLANGLNGLYRGHAAVMLGDETAAMEDYNNIFNEELLGLALYYLDRIAKLQPVHAQRIKSFENRLLTTLSKQLSPGTAMTSQTYAEYFRAKQHVLRAGILADWTGAARWNRQALEQISRVAADTAERYQTYEIFVNQIDTYLGQSYYELYASVTDRQALDRAIEYSKTAIEKVNANQFFEYPSTNYLNTNLAHAYALRNGPGDRTLAIETYRQFLSNSFDQIEGWEILKKDFSDLNAGGIVLPDFDNLLREIDPIGEKGSSGF